MVQQATKKSAKWILRDPLLAEKTALTQGSSLSDAAKTARDTALAQLRTAVAILRNDHNSSGQLSSLKMHVDRLFDAPEELLWIDYIAPTIETVLPGKLVPAKEQFLIIEKSLLLLGIEIDTLYLDEPEEKSWFLNWKRAKKARLFWTKSLGWSVTLYLTQGDGYTCSGFVLDDFLQQIGVDQSFWDVRWERSAQQKQ